MADLTTTATNKQHFTGSGENTIIFSRSINHLILSVSGGSVGMSLDGGTNFMPVCEGVHQFLWINVERIFFNGAGTYSGIGQAA